jgi:hypothetical protein
LDELNEVHTIDGKVYRSIQSVLKYGMDEPSGLNGMDLRLNSVQKLDGQQVNYLREWDPHAYEKTWLYQSYLKYSSEYPKLMSDLPNFEGHLSGNCHHELELNGLLSLNLSAAKILRTIRSDGLQLNGLMEIDPPVLRTLTRAAEFNTLSLNGLSILSTSHVESLQDFVQGEWEWGGYNTLYLKGVKEIDVETLNAMSSWTGGIVYLGLETVSVEQAIALQNLNIMQLHLDSLSHVSKAALAELIKVRVLSVEPTIETGLDVETARTLHRVSNQNFPSIRPMTTDEYEAMLERLAGVAFIKQSDE